MALFQAYLVQSTARQSVTLQDVRQNRRMGPKVFGQPSDLLVFSIGARKSFSRLYLSHCPTLGRFFSQFEAPIQRKGLWSPGR